MNHKKAQGISLQFLLGLVFTGFLILFAYIIVSQFFYSAPIERDAVDYWAKEINNLKDSNKITQLLPLSLKEVPVSYVIIIPASFADDDIEYLRHPNPEKDLIHNLFNPSCGDSNCVCSYNVDTEKTYCQKISGKNTRYLGYNVGAVDYQNVGFFYNPQSKNIPEFGALYYSSKAPYVKVLGDTLYICDSREQCTN